MLKLLSLEARLANKPQVAIYVMSNEAVINSLKIGIDITASTRPIYTLDSGDTLPNVKPDVIYFSYTNKNQLAAVRAYCQKHNVLLIGDEPNQIANGFAIVLHNDEGLPGIVLNISQSKTLGLKWHPDVLNVVSIYE